MIIKLDANGEIPGCNIVCSFEANVTDTSAIITDTSVVPQESSVVPSDTNVLPQDTLAETNVICGVSPNISVSPMSYNFGSVYVGSTSLPQTFAISNTGGADLNIGAIGTNNFEFIIENDSCSGHSIVPLATCTLDVVFSTTSAGSKSSTLSIPSNDPDTPTAGIPLSGTGINML